MTLDQLPPFDSESNAVHVIIDTPRGSRNKYSWNEKWKLFELTGVLPAGAVFPFDFGFIPQTRGGDGDPLDVLVLLDEPAVAGSLVRTRLIGVIEAEQTEEGRTTRNDRLVGVAVKSRNDRDYQTLEDLSGKLVEEIEYFFVSYNKAKGKTFRPLGRFGPDRARKLVDAARNPPQGGRGEPRLAVQ